MIANLMAGTKGSSNMELSEDLLRHMVMTTLKNLVSKFKRTYGPEIVICCDGKNIWRKKVYPYYKATRKKNRDDSPYDWRLIFDTLDKIKEEIKEFMPYTVIDVDSAEADDVIGVLCAMKEDMFPSKKLIISGDGDFVQLQKYPHVEQWDRGRKRWLTGDPVEHLKKKLIRGDTGDGVPNFLTADDVLVTPGARSKPVMAVKEEVWLKQDPSEFCDTEEKKANWQRNVTMMDLSQTPPDVVAEIMDKYRVKHEKTRADIMTYFAKFGLRKLMQDIQDFV